jgi:hypothetical protein
LFLVTEKDVPAKQNAKSKEKEKTVVKSDESENASKAPPSEITIY